MRTGEKLCVLAGLVVGPATAYASEGAPSGTILFALAGGFAGGFLGSVLACWLCKRKGKSDGDTPPRK